MPMTPYTLVTRENYRTGKLVEMPHLMPDWDFGLEKPEMNLSQLGILQAEPDNRQIGEYQGLPIYAAGNYIYAVVDGNLHYMVKLEEASLPGKRGAGYATQVALWRKNYDQYHGLTTYVFWNFIFPLHEAVMTDNSQTTSGKRFWQGQVFEALRRHMHVYFVNLAEPSARPIKTEAEYHQAVTEAYGIEDKHKDLRLLIMKAQCTLPAMTKQESKVGASMPCYL